MEMSRRSLIRSALVLGGVAAVSREMVFGSLAEEALAAGRTTANGTYGPGAPGAKGYCKIVARPADARVVRTDLGIAAGAARSKHRKGLLAFAQLSDVHVVDHQSPARVEWTDRYDDPNSTGQVPGIFASAYRPQEMLTAQVGDAMVRAINAVKTAPVTGLPLLFAIETGDNSDNCQYNEVRWNIDVLDGKRVVPDSGNLTRYEGVMDGDPLYYDTHYWHPGGSPLGKAVDRYRGETTASRPCPSCSTPRAGPSRRGSLHPLVHLLRQPRRPLAGQLPAEHRADLDPGHRRRQGDLPPDRCLRRPTCSTRRARRSTRCSVRSPSRRTPRP